MRIAIVASLCLAVFACGQGGSLSGNSGKKTADSRGSRSGETAKKPQKNDAKSEDSASNDNDDSNNDESRVVAPEGFTSAYLTCTAAITTSTPAPAGTKYFGCIAVDARKQRIDLKNSAVQFVLRDLQGNALDVKQVSLPDADKDVVWAVPFEVYKAGISPEASLPGAGSGTGATIKRKCFMKIQNATGETEQEAQCQVST